MIRPSVDTPWRLVDCDLGETRRVCIGRHIESACRYVGALHVYDGDLPSSNAMDIVLNEGGAVLVTYRSTQERWGCRVVNKRTAAFVGGPTPGILTLHPGGVATAGFLKEGPDPDEEVLVRALLSSEAATRTVATSPGDSGFAQAEESRRVAEVLRDGIRAAAGGYFDGDGEDAPARARKARAIPLCAVLDHELNAPRFTDRETLGLKEILGTRHNNDFLAKGIFSLLVEILRTDAGLARTADERMKATLERATGIQEPKSSSLDASKGITRALRRLGAVDDAAIRRAREDWAAYLVKQRVLPNSPDLRAALELLAAPGGRGHRPADAVAADLATRLPADHAVAANAGDLWQVVRAALGNPLIDALELQCPESTGLTGVVELAQVLSEAVLTPAGTRS